MGRYLRKCKGLAIEKAAEMEAAAAAGGRKRKVYLGESEVSTSSVQLKTRRLDVATPENSGNSSCETENGLASCCSSNELTKAASKFVDLEDNNEVTDPEFTETSAGDSFNCRERIQTTPLREDQVESGELESTASPREPNPRHRSTAEKMPSEGELEEFFAAAEKNLQKKFIEKYNYDIVKDQPLEGRYEWVQLQVKP